MINIRTNQGGHFARKEAEVRNGGRAVHIVAVFHVRGSDGKFTDENDYVFSSTVNR